MTNETPAGGTSRIEAATAGPHGSGQESTLSALLRERSRRTTVTSVLDLMIETGGQFAERRADGSGWSVAIPTNRPCYDTLAR